MKNLFIYLYVLFIFTFVIFTYAFIDPNLIYLREYFSGFAYSHRFIVSVLYVFFICMFYGFYLIFLKRFRSKIYGLKKGLFLIAISILLLLSYSVFISYDIFNYYATARVVFHYGENPYLVMPIEFMGDTMLLFTRAANKYALYGPTWISLTGISHIFSFGNFIAEIILLKIMVSVFYAGIIFLLYKISKNINAVMFFALNPLVIIETFISGHNDCVMMFLALLGLYLFKKNRKTLGILSMLISILVKFASISLLPVFVYAFIKRHKKQDISWDYIWLLSAGCMGIIFLLSPMREEMYPWYFIWILPFLALLKNKKLIKMLAISFSFGMLMYYVPYMYFGYYLILLKIGIVFMSTLACMCLLIVLDKKKVWEF